MNRFRMKSRLASLYRNREPYNFLGYVGRGTVGCVHHVKDCDGNEFALKCIPRGRHIVDNRVLAEVINHRTLVHPHVIQFEEVFLTRDYLCIVMQYAPDGPLLDRLMVEGPLGEFKARFYFQQLIIAIDYCHHKGIAHRDIKLENLCFNKHEMMMCDFGYSKSSEWQSAAKTRAGSPNYMAPEVTSVLTGQRYCGMMADVWSCGVILYAMITKQFPFSSPQDSDDVSDLAIYRRIMSVDYTMPPEISPELCDLFSRIFVKDPAERVTIEGIKAHPWFLTNLPDGALDLKDRCLECRPLLTQTEAEIRSILCEAEAFYDE